MNEEMKEMIDALLEMSKEMLGDEELVDVLATFNWRYYSKLRDKGFSDEAALTIVSAVGTPFQLNK